MFSDTFGLNALVLEEGLEDVLLEEFLEEELLEEEAFLEEEGRFWDDPPVLLLSDSIASLAAGRLERSISLDFLTGSLCVFSASRFLTLSPVGV